MKDKALKQLKAGFSGVTMFFYAGGDLPQDPKWEANSVKRSKHKIQFGLSLMIFPVSFHFCLVVVVCRNKLGKLSTLIPLTSTKFGHQANKETSWLEHLENTLTKVFSPLFFGTRNFEISIGSQLKDCIVKNLVCKMAPLTWNSSFDAAEIGSINFATATFQLCLVG